MKSPITVRPVRSEDEFAVGELLVDSFVKMYAEKLPQVVVTDQRKADLRNVREKRLSPLVSVLVAEQNGRIIGTVSLFKPEDVHSRAWLPNTSDLRYLAVSLDSRGLGVSNLLLDAAVVQARAWGVDQICLHVRRGATGVAGVYTRYGFLRAEEGDQDLLPEIYLEAYWLPLRQ